MSKLAVKRALGRLCRLAPRSPQRRIVLLYHAVGDSPWALSRESFAGQMAWLAEAAVIRPFADVLQSPVTAGIEVAITFDDGYWSLLTAGEILNEYGAGATVYLNTGWVGDTMNKRSVPEKGHYPDERFLTWDEVTVLQRAGWSIGAHGVEHLDLTALPRDRVEHELNESRLTVEDRLGISCEHFSYTWGRYDAVLQKAVREAGYATAVTGRHGPVSEDFDPFAIPRINVQRDYTPDDFVAIVRGDWDYLGWMQGLWRG